MAGKAGVALGPRPHTWCTGPDPLRHEQFRVWGQMRNQAQWRGEQWQLTLEDFIRVWGTAWPRRGRTIHSDCMTRCDPTQPWSGHNVQIVTRQQHAQRQAHSRSR